MLLSYCISKSFVQKKGDLLFGDFLILDNISRANSILNTEKRLLGYIEYLLREKEQDLFGML